MSDKKSIVEAIRSTPLTDDELCEIIGAATGVMMGNAFVGIGMDLVTGQDEDDAV
jgi:hypothetical protein